MELLVTIKPEVRTLNTILNKNLSQILLKSIRTDLDNSQAYWDYRKKILFYRYSKFKFILVFKSSRLIFSIIFYFYSLFVLLHFPLIPLRRVDAAWFLLLFKPIIQHLNPQTHTIFLGWPSLTLLSYWIHYLHIENMFFCLVTRMTVIVHLKHYTMKCCNLFLFIFIDAQKKSQSLHYITYELNHTNSN